MRITLLNSYSSIYGSTVLIFLVFTMIYPLQARQFRLLNPIATPTVSNLPEGAVAVTNAQPLLRQDIEPLVKETITKWNTAEMSETLADTFYDQNRLQDAMDTIVPRDAKLQIQSIQGIQTVQQYILPDSNNGRGELVSIVSVTVRTQVEFNSPGGGFTRLPGINEFILEVTQPAPP